MAKGTYLGEFEQLVLLALLRLGADAYGMTIRREIEQRAGRPVSIGAAYATLERLEAKGYVRSKLGKPTAERGGRAKRFYKLKPAGETVLRDSLQTVARMAKGLEAVVGTN